MTLYDEVLEVAKDYMGPTAERFVNRQLNGHLDIEPHQLSGHHLEELANWCYTSGKLIMRDERAREFSKKVQALKG
jgi:hypothetical protein